MYKDQRNCESCMECFNLIDDLVTYILELESAVVRLQSTDPPDKSELFLPYCDFSEVKAYRKYVDHSWFGEDPLTSEAHLAEMWRDIARNRNPHNFVPF